MVVAVMTPIAPVVKIRILIENLIPMRNLRLMLRSLFFLNFKADLCWLIFLFQSLIDRKKQDFRKIEDEIEIEIEKQEAKEKSIAQQEEGEEEDDDDDDDEDSDVGNSKSNSGPTSRLQEVRK